MDYRVTSVSEFKGDTLRIDFDCHEPLFINKEVVERLGIREGGVLSDADIEGAVYKNEYRRARERALYLLDEREYGYAEMFKKLERNYSEDICYAVVNDLSRLGLIDDRRYARALAEYLVVKKMRGKYRAREEMHRRGIPREIVEEALGEYEDGTAERLTELIEKKYLRRLHEENGVNKVKAALVRQGYGYDEINAALKELDGEKS